MKKQLKTFFILLTIVFSIFNFTNEMLLPAVKATYVEGPITNDTIWTLVDSPFVVSNDVIVYPNATLTIEPGVEVRFGENLCLIIEGKLIANGTIDRIIRFTSNKREPKAGDWRTIKFDSTQSSSLEYCIIEYGANGTTVENGFVNIQKNLISKCENGIVIANGYVTVRNNTIVNSTISGIYISNCNQVTIQNNVISSNMDGIILTGTLTSDINIHQNIILLNEHSGILCEADALDKTFIRNNTLSENYYGFYVSTDASTYITLNYILNNTIGIFYESGTSHIAHFNDICDNDVGIDVSPNAIVDATYNYWGAKSGPYHKSLNPRGKGNPVGGNGVNLDFVFFLTFPIDHNNTRPKAILWTDKVLVTPNQTVTFIGADSYDDGQVDQYFYDFADNTNSSWTSLSLFAHNYSSTGTYNASLKVIDDFNATSDEVFATVTVLYLPPLEASITLSNHTVNYNKNVLVTVYVSSALGAVAYANVTLFSVRGGSFSLRSGLTDSNGYFTTTFTAPNVTEITNVRIIARASKTYYADGSDHEDLKVIPPLIVHVTAEPTRVRSEETARVTVHVTDSFEEPGANATLTLSCDNGYLSATTGVTDVDGIATFNFTALQTLIQIDATIVVNATKMGHADGSGQGIITIEPKLLVVEVTADLTIIVSEAKINVTVQVTYEGTPIPEANVTMRSENGGIFYPTFGLSDKYGNTTFIFTAPPVDTPLNITLSAQAAKDEYVDGENKLNITVNPGILEVNIQAEPSAVMPDGLVVVSVYVTCNATPVADALVRVFYNNETIAAATGYTNSSGYYTFIFNAPTTTTPISVLITANATKGGYESGENQTSITVSPEIAEVGGGWPLATILLITIPIVVVVIVVVLIKSKKIAFSFGGEE